MCYHFAIIHLFHPFLDMQLVGAKLSPTSICHQAANAIQGLLKSYSQLHTLDRAPVFVPFLAMASAVSHLEKPLIPAPALGSNSDTDMVTVNDVSHHALEKFDQDISFLSVLSGWHYSAVQAMGFLRTFAKKRKLEVDISEDIISSKDYDRLARPYLHRICFKARKVAAEEVVVS